MGNEAAAGVMAPSEGRRDAVWWKSVVVYQIYPRSFADSNGDGFGDLGGIIERLDHLQALGVDVVWLSPIYRSPQADNGYDISDYRDIDPMFGTLAEFDTLLTKVHELGMKLVMDLVVNHTSDEHQWFVESRSSRDSPKRDWYIWRDAGDGAEPNNWGSFFGGSAWEWEPTTGQYYLHLFDRKQPDLNWENQQVRKAVHDIMRWWLDRGVDGFRMDVINFISKAEGLPDTPAVPGQRFVIAFEGFAHGPRVHDYLAEMTREVFAGRDGEFITVGEMPGVTLEEARHYTDPARGELNMVFQFEHMSVDHSPTNKFDYLGLDLAGPEERALSVAGGVGGNWLEQPVLGQPRPASRRVPVRRRRPGLLGRFGEGARDRSARHAWHPVRLSRRGTRNDELPVPDSAGPQGSRGRELLQACARAGRRRGCGAGRSSQDQPRQRPHTNAMGRGTERRIHRR